MIFNDDHLKNLSNKKLYELLNEKDWTDQNLLKEYDERIHDGRIVKTPIYDLEEHFKKRREKRNIS